MKSVVKLLHTYFLWKLEAESSRPLQRLVWLSPASMAGFRSFGVHRFERCRGTSPIGSRSHRLSNQPTHSSIAKSSRVRMAHEILHDIAARNESDSELSAGVGSVVGRVGEGGNQSTSESRTPRSRSHRLHGGLDRRR